ncbi:MAG TPA: hypothetical protein PKA28_15655 [Methylomusa anaerophila]|uniref:Uncharacterized protein n=1 Tax=Methylomusa anaerophila TaxID=1930071 RepID=A0A348AHD0_9FIRM|nr:hypothetical protein [Methylomusa anaerophila]BBB90478.1 hypothetical protein MAMMFC1_01129 [Methylomusa anaerophila]HML89879.1 hypothetical protein [Methylomusa anaerophila]
MPLTDTPQTIINTILADINAVIPNFSSLVSSYRLLVGSAEEIHRIPDAPFEVFERALIRCDRAGTLIDTLLELLCCKITFSSEFLSVTCAPVDLLQYLTNRTQLENTAHHTAEQIVVIEIMRRLLERIGQDGSCFGPPPPITPQAPPAPTGPPPQAPTGPPPPPRDLTCKELETEAYADTQTEVEKELATEANFVYGCPEEIFDSPLKRRHI